MDNQETVPEYVKHVRENGQDKIETPMSYCGKDVLREWHFVSVTHLIVERRRQGRLLPCPECLKKILEILSN
jgi:hypothetical protein